MFLQHFFIAYYCDDNFGFGLLKVNIRNLLMTCLERCLLC